MPIECLISFDNNTQGVYYAGQELSGVVDLTVDTTKRIKGKQTIIGISPPFFLCVFILSTLPPDYPLPQCTQAARFVHVYVCVCCSVTATVQSMTQKDVLSHFREVLSRRFLFCKH